MLNTLCDKCEQFGRNKSSVTWSLDPGWGCPMIGCFTEQMPGLHSRAKSGRMNGKERPWGWVGACVRTVGMLKNLCEGVCWRGEELYKWATVLASLDWERTGWRGQGDKRATANSKSDQVMEKGGAEGRETDCDTWETQRGITDCLALTYSREAWTSVALSRSAVKDQTETAWTGTRGPIQQHHPCNWIQIKVTAQIIHPTDRSWVCYNQSLSSVLYSTLKPFITMNKSPNKIWSATPHWILLCARRAQCTLGYGGRGRKEEVH